MCPDELGSYENDIISIQNFYCSKFYDYHKIFSAKAAVLMREKVKNDCSLCDLVSLVVGEKLLTPVNYAITSIMSLSFVHYNLQIKMNLCQEFLEKFLPARSSKNIC